MILDSFSKAGDYAKVLEIANKLKSDGTEIDLKCYDIIVRSLAKSVIII